ncbi:hypothetical protein FRC00_009536 [Tulasnella sp. 408]|nr:hypothetical protein FRC00_009536 [Tulasnella sp. 408]
MRLRPLYVSLAAPLASFVSAGTDDSRPAPDPNNKPSSAPSHNFSQLIDHTQPSLGTFNQRYFFSDEFWTGEGAPIIIFNEGEQSAARDADTLQDRNALITALMKSLGAAGVIIERKYRYWGTSSPYESLTTANLKYLTVDQSIEDMKVGAVISNRFLLPVAHPHQLQYFIETVDLPWKGGGSYPGALVAYTQNKYPNLFAAAWATSAPVQAQGDFWLYFEPIAARMPQNCRKDVAAVITHIDRILLYGTQDEKHKLKESFGLENLEDAGDFASQLVEPLFYWQSLTVSHFQGQDHAFYRFCDAIETGLEEKSADDERMKRALENYGEWMKNRARAERNCPGGGCYTTFKYDWPQYWDLTAANKWNRQWWWMQCNEFGWWQVGDPGNRSSIVSSFLTEEWNLRQCNYMFRNDDETPGNFRPDVSKTNLNHGGGWNLEAYNLFVVNGEFDPWRWASLSSKWAPPFRNTRYQHAEIIKDGVHCWDWNLDQAKFNPDIKRVVDLGISMVKGWVEEWYSDHQTFGQSSLPDIEAGEFWNDIFKAEA